METPDTVLLNYVPETSVQEKLIAHALNGLVPFAVNVLVPRQTFNEWDVTDADGNIAQSDLLQANLDEWIGQNLDGGAIKAIKNQTITVCLKTPNDKQ